MALAKLGAIMIPVNTGYTGREASYVLSQSDSEFLIIDAAYLTTIFREGHALAIPARNVIVRGKGFAAGRPKLGRPSRRGEPF